MKRGFLFLGSTGRWPVVVGSLPTTPQRHARIRRYERSMSFSAGCRKGQASSLCSPEKRLERSGKFTALKLLLPIFIGCFTHPTGAVTLENVLQTTMEKNPEIQEAKAGL